MTTANVILFVLWLVVCVLWPVSMRRLNARWERRVGEYRATLCGVLHKEQHEVREAGGVEFAEGVKRAEEIVYNSWRFTCLRSDYEPTWRGAGRM